VFHADGLLSNIAAIHLVGVLTAFVVIHLRRSSNRFDRLRSIQLSPGDSFLVRIDFSKLRLPRFLPGLLLLLS
jgi:hypothetical protein